MTDDTTAENPLDQFGLGPQDEAHDNLDRPRKVRPAVEGDDSSVNNFGLGPQDKERHHS